MPDESTKDEVAGDEAKVAPDEPDEDALQNAAAAIEDARRRIAEVPAEVVVTNHVMGLYELAAIHLSAPTPDLAAASLAIDAVGSLVEGLGDRLGRETPTIRDALANIRLAYVRVKRQQAEASEQPAPDGPGDPDAPGDPRDRGDPGDQGDRGDPGEAHDPAG